MKKKFFVEVDIDTNSRKGWAGKNSVGEAVNAKARNPLFQSLHLHLINARKQITLAGTDRMQLAMTLAHEFGHIIADELELSGATQDRRSHPELSQSWDGKAISRGVLASEIEAWRLAAPAFRKTVELCLGTYARDMDFEVIIVDKQKLAFEESRESDL